MDRGRTSRSSPGTSDFGPGTNRVSFLVVDKQSKLIERPTARVWISRGLKQKPYAQTTAKLEPIGVPGGATADAQNIYVTSVDTPKPGTYWILAEPVGGKKIQALGNLVVRQQAAAPSVGEQGDPVQEPHARAGRRPEDGHDGRAARPRPPSHHRRRRAWPRSGRSSSRSRRPLYCQTRTCGPVVQVAQSVAKKLAGQGCRLHPHRDLQGQRPCERDEPLGRRVEAADASRSRSSSTAPASIRTRIEGRLQPGRARDGCRQGRRLTRGRHADRRRVAQPSPCAATTLRR